MNDERIAVVEEPTGIQAASEFVNDAIGFDMHIKKMAAKYAEISKTRTAHKKKSRVIGKDKEGRKVYEDYLEEHNMRSFLDAKFPGWSWTPGNNPICIELTGGILYIVSGVLEIVDIDYFHFLVKCGIPPERADFKRKFYGHGGGFFDTRKGEAGVKVLQKSIPAKTANTEALKYAINRLTRYGDDVYRKEDTLGLTQSQIVEVVDFIQSIPVESEEKSRMMSKLFSDIDGENVKQFMEALKQRKDQLEKEYEEAMEVENAQE